MWTNDLLKYVFSHMRVNGRQGVIKQVDRAVAVDGPGQAHPLLLTP